MMLYKKVGAETKFWEVWKNGRSVTVHQGTVGTAGETEELELRLFQSAGRLMKQLADEKIRTGFEPMDEDEMYELVVQYRSEEGGMPDTSDERQVIDDLLDDCLEGTGNGFCDGMGTFSTFYYVLDLDKAFRTITEELAKHGFPDNIEIAYSEPGKDEYISLHPEGATFVLMEDDDD